VTARLGRRRRLCERASITPVRLCERAPFARVFFEPTLRFPRTDAPCRCDLSSRSPLEPRHLQPPPDPFRARRTTSLPSGTRASSTLESHDAFASQAATPSLIWPPDPVLPTRHSRAALRARQAAPWLRTTIRLPCAAPRLLSIQRSSSTPRASSDFDLGRLASCLRRMTSMSERCDAFPLLRSGASISRLTLCEGWWQLGAPSPVPLLALTPTMTTARLVDLPPLEVVRTPLVTHRCPRSFGSSSQTTVRCTVSEESMGLTCSTEVGRVLGLPAEARREARTGELDPRCLPSSRHDGD
jgi:hypothetical protein